jgi:glycosyltransferase 2 family protein
VRHPAWASARLLGGAAILGCLLWRLGSGPFVAGLRAISVPSVLAVTAITAVTTVCSAWRWQVVARGLGVGMPLRAAVAAYYRSQFLNSALPGGVAGDLHRGLLHGRDAGDIGRGLRAVAWERAAGQAVQAVLAGTVLVTLASPARSGSRWVVAAALGAALCGGLLVRLLPRRRSFLPATVVRAARSDVRNGLLAPAAWPAVAAASVVVVAGHTGSMLIALRSSGSAAPLTRLLPLAVLVLLAMVVPLTIGGWGPREGVAAWVFGAAGLGAEQGVAAATAYGGLALVATLPGAVVLAAGLRRSAAAGPAVSGTGGPDDGPQSAPGPGALSAAPLPGGTRG